MKQAALSGILTAALLLTLACGGNPPPPPPPPPPHTAECQALLDSGLPWCDQVEPPITCGDCVHNPTSDPRHCEKAQDCEEPPPPPPPPPPMNCAAETDLVASTCSAPYFMDEVKAATNALGDLTGGNPQENLRRLAAQLRVQMPGRCVIAGQEAVFMLRPDGLYEENHAVFFGTGSWTNSGRGVFVGCHLDRVPPEPPVCGLPTPPPLSHFRGPAEKFCDPGQCCDATPYVCDAAYCLEIGFTDGRRCCSVRTEGSPDREACEELVTGGTIWTSNTTTELCNDNPYRARCLGACAWIQISNAAGDVVNRKTW